MCLLDPGRFAQDGGLTATMDVELWARAGSLPHPDVMKIPTPPLQRTAVAIIFFFPSLALVIFCMRAYIRTFIRQLGLGAFQDG